MPDRRPLVKNVHVKKEIAGGKLINSKIKARHSTGKKNEKKN